MTKSELVRHLHQENMLMSLGFTLSETQTLRRISLTLRRWHERECGIDGGCIERDEKTNRPYWVTERGSRWTIPDRETGARKRLYKILSDRNTRAWIGTKGSINEVSISAYIQTDPRGAALYLLRPGDIPDGMSADSCYSRGLCIY